MSKRYKNSASQHQCNSVAETVINSVVAALQGRCIQVALQGRCRDGVLKQRCRDGVSSRLAAIVLVDLLTIAVRYESQLLTQVLLPFTMKKA